MTADIKVISFDLDDTLWPGMPTILAAEQVLFNWLSEHAGIITQHYDIQQLREKRRGLLKKHPELAHDLTRLRRLSFEELADEFSLDRDWIQPAFDTFYEARQQVRLFDDVEPVLDELKRHYRLASLTNGNADPDKTGVAHWFEYSLNSITAGSLKSEPAIYHQLQQQMEVNPAQHVHVGDDPENDIAGARAAGAYTIWLNRDRKAWPFDNCRPDAQIETLYALRQALAVLPL